MQAFQSRSRAVRTLASIVLAAAFAGPVTSAVAQNLYVGASLGQSTVKDIECDFDITCSSDDTDTGWKIFGGFQFNPNVAVEIGYVDLGESSGSGTDSFLGAASATIETSGFTLAGVGSLPFGQGFSVFGKIGLFMWDEDISASSSVFGSGSTSESGTDLFFGVGLSYDITKSLAVRAEWERFSDVGDADSTGESDIDLLSVGLTVKF